MPRDLYDSMGRVRGGRWRGKLRPPPRCHPLVRQLWAVFNRDEWLLAEVARASGVAVATIKGWGRRANPNLETFEAVANAVGWRLRLVPMEEESESP